MTSGLAARGWKENHAVWDSRAAPCDSQGGEFQRVPLFGPGRVGIWGQRGGHHDTAVGDGQRRRPQHDRARRGEFVGQPGVGRRRGGRPANRFRAEQDAGVIFGHFDAEGDGQMDPQFLEARQVPLITHASPSALAFKPLGHLD